MTRTEFKEKINSYLEDIRRTRGKTFVESYFDKLADRTLFVTHPDDYDGALDIWEMRLRFLSLENFVSNGGSWQTASASLYMRCKAPTLEACYIWSARNYLYDMYGFDLLASNGSYDSTFISSRQAEAVISSMMLRKASRLDDRYIYIGYDPTELLTKKRDLNHETAYLKHCIHWTLVATLDGSVPLNVTEAKDRTIDELLDCGFIEDAPAANCFCCDYSLGRSCEDGCAYCPVIAHSIAFPDRMQFFVPQLGCGCANVGGYYRTLCDINNSISDSTKRKIAAKIALFPRSAFVDNPGKDAGHHILSDCAIACRYLCEYMLAENAEERAEIEALFRVWTSHATHARAKSRFTLLAFNREKGKDFINALRVAILDVLKCYHGMPEHDDTNEEVEEQVKGWTNHITPSYKYEHEGSSNTMNGEKLTLDEAIKNHRIMWKWISRESLSQKRKVTKKEAFKHFGWTPVSSNCWCCAYNESVYKAGDAACVSCPVKWPDGTCLGSPGVPTLYASWENASDDEYVLASFKADRIANLPVNEKLYNKKDDDSMAKRQLDLLGEFVDCTTKHTQVVKKWMDLIKEMDREP